MMLKYVITAATIAVASPALAIVPISNIAGAPDPGIPTGYTTVIDFETGWPSELNTITLGDVITAAGTQSGRAAPAGDNTVYQSVGPTDLVNPASSFFDFTTILPTYRPYLTGFSLYWGSVDTYNTLEFFNSSGNLVHSITGSGISNPADGNRPGASTNRRVTFGFTQVDDITGVKFLSTRDAFEFDDIAISTSVPEPASWAMLIAGFGLIGATMRRRRQQIGSVLA